jgi:hypothetical protein
VRPSAKRRNHTGKSGLPALRRNWSICAGVPQSFSTMTPKTFECAT